MAIRKIPPINAIDVVENIGTDTDTALDFTTASRINTEVSANSALLLSGINIGDFKVARIKNTHATTTIAITLPTTYNSIATIRELDTAYIPAGKYVKFYFTYTDALEIEFDGAI